MYAKYIKRILDFVLSLCALIVLSPLMVILTIVGAVAMHGNPFYTQERPGRIDKSTGIETRFLLVKFRSMSNLKDEQGKLLPDNVRLNTYGKLLRKSSLDELPELLNILKGDMSIVGPRPLLVRYLPYYTQEEHHRHDVRPGLTGLAQVNGRNNLEWNSRLQLDLDYVKNISFFTDCHIVLLTVQKVLRHDDVVTAGEFKMLSLDEERREKVGNH